MRELGLDAFRFSIAWPRVLPDGRGTRERGGPRLLRPARRRAARQRHRAVRDALPLGHAAGARGRGRLAGARHRRRVLRVRRGGRGAARRPRRPLDHAQRAVGRLVGRPRLGPSRARAATSEPDALATAHHLLLSHGRAVEILRRALARRRRSGSRSTSTIPYAGERRRRTTSPPRAGSTGCTTAGSSTRSSAARYPEDMLEAWAAIMPEIHDGDLETISAPIDFLGVNNYTSPLVAADAERRPLADRAPRRRRPHRHGLGGRPGRAARPARPAAATTTSRRRST